MNLKKRILSCIIVLIFLAIICLVGYADRDFAEVMGRAVQSGGRKIALTFDDGPHPYYTGQLLDGLKERGVNVTFFVTGKQAEAYPELIKRMQEEGD